MYARIQPKVARKYDKTTSCKKECISPVLMSGTLPGSKDIRRLESRELTLKFGVLEIDASISFSV